MVQLPGGVSAGVRLVIHTCAVSPVDGVWPQHAHIFIHANGHYTLPNSARVRMCFSDLETANWHLEVMFRGHLGPEGLPLRMRLGGLS